jgi:asparagine synthase (glutamine-hydrolysing)
MLLAALSAAGLKSAQEIVDRLARTFGPPTVSLPRGNAVVARWGDSNGITGGNDRQWIAEGWLEVDDVEISPQSLQAAKGDFALFALRDDGVLLASGRGGGARAIFVASPSPELVVACTRLSPLVALLRERSLNAAYLCAFIMGSPTPPEVTPYAGIRRVPLGQAWIIQPDTPVGRWMTSKPLLAPEQRDNDELPALLRHAIERAVFSAAKDSRQIGVEVSGGLDSSMIFSLLVAHARRGDIPAIPAGITCEFSTPIWHDDRPYLRSLERHVGLHVQRAKPEQAASFLHNRMDMEIDAMPVPSPFALAASAMATMARAQGIDVLLVGDGGDQILDGSVYFFGELARRGKIVQALDGALRTRGVFYHGPFGRLLHFILRPQVERLVPRSALALVRRLRRRIPRWAGPVLGRTLRVDTAPVRTPSLTEAPGVRYARLLRDPVLESWSLTRLQQEVLCGYTIRAPLLDDDFLRFAATLPPLSLLHGGYRRGLMREAMRGLVPEDLRLRVTKGAWIWFVEQTFERAGGLRVFADLANVRCLADLGLIEPRAFKTLFENACRRPSQADYDELWRILSLEGFIRQQAGHKQREPHESN